MSVNALRGPVAAAATPLGPDLVPDAAGLVRHCRWLLERGCRAVLCLGTTGEATSLSVDERLALIDALGQAGLGRQLMLGVGSCAVPDTVRLARRALEAGITHLLCLPPFYYRKATEDGVVAFLSRVLDQLDPSGRLYLYNIPSNTGVPVTTGLVQRLRAAHPGVVAGIKDSSGDWSSTGCWLSGFADLSVFSGTEEHLLAVLRRGGPGCISATFNIYPDLAAELHRDWQEPEAEQRQARLMALRRVFARHPMIPAVKAALARMTNEAGWARVRPPLLPLDEASTDDLLEELARAGLELGPER